MSETPKVARSTEGLRDALFDEIDALRRGESTSMRCNAIARAAGTIVGIVNMEMELFKLNQQIEKEKAEQQPVVSMPPKSARMGKALETPFKLGGE